MIGFVCRRVTLTWKMNRRNGLSLGRPVGGSCKSLGERWWGQDGGGGSAAE